MAKRFKARRRHIKLYLVVVFLSFCFSLYWFSRLLTNETFLEFLMNSIFNTENVYGSNSLLDFLLDYTIGKNEEVDEEYDGSTSLYEYTPDPNPEENKKGAIIYLYNTHQGEEYTGDILEDYSVVPTVMLAGYRLREELNNYGLNTIMETNEIKTILNLNGWSYSSSYKASRILLENAKIDNPTLEYFFDIHRDAISYESSIITYGEKTYAKILFVIGTDYDNYEDNLELASTISDTLNSLVPGISRGIITKGGEGVNGIYNQDFAPTTLLFEIGGEYNKISEVNNTIAILAQAIKEVIGD